MVRGMMGRPSWSRGIAMKLGREFSPAPTAVRATLAGACSRWAAETEVTRPWENVIVTGPLSAGRATERLAERAGRPGTGRAEPGRGMKEVPEAQ